MTRVTVKTIAKAYFVTVLLLAVLFSPLPQIGIALVLLATQIGSAYKPPKANLNLALVLGSVIFTPLALEALAGRLLAVIAIIPGILLLDKSLKENAPSPIAPFMKIGRSPTTALKALITSLLLILAASIILVNFTLTLTAAILISYLGAALSYFFLKVPRMPFEESKTWNRVVVGEKANNKFQLKGKSALSLFVSLTSTTPWIQITPSNFELPTRTEKKVDLQFTPPLAGPSKLQVQALTLDSRGLIQTGQVLEPVDLHIIPRVKYAQWLANKYLEQTASGAGLTSLASSAMSSNVAKSVEYYGSRQYQPGDRWKDLDWKHTYLFGELIVKEFSGAHGQTAILVADLTAKDAEEADKLAYNFVMSALTLADESLPTALAVYNHANVLAALQPMNPREVLKKTLELTEKIVMLDPSEKVLQSTELLRLKRSIGQLEQANSVPSQRLVEILKLEFEANQKTAMSQPAGQVLAKIVEAVSPPATLTVVSSLSRDDEALAVTLERLKEKGYNTVLLRTK
jgi:hypothetical protein